MPLNCPTGAPWAMGQHLHSQRGTLIIVQPGLGVTGPDVAYASE
jgi:hypothetical protein